MNVALIQFQAGSLPEDNLRRVKILIDRAVEGGARFVMLPEVSHFRGGRSARESHRAAESVPGPTTRALGGLARKHRIFLHNGSMLEKSSRHSKLANTSVIFNPDGEIIAIYRKIHLFYLSLGKQKITESRIFRAGRRRVIVPVGPFRMGCSICYDLRFPELYRWYRRNGADLLCVPSAFTKATGKAHWQTLLRARAIENLSYVLAPNQIGEDARGVETYGHSMIITPWGEILAEGSGHREEIVSGRIIMTDIKKRRRTGL